MQRLFEKRLFDWKESGMKKPLMVVGKRNKGMSVYGRKNEELI